MRLDLNHLSWPTASSVEVPLGLDQPGFLDKQQVFTHVSTLLSREGIIMRLGWFWIELRILTNHCLSVKDNKIPSII